jgi:hypothetical protein
MTNRPMFGLALTMAIAASLSEGCASSHGVMTRAAASAPGGTLVSASPSDATITSSAAEVLRTAHVTEVPVEKDARPLQGRPLSAVVVTQCDLIVAVYLTLQDGRLLRFDHTAAVPAERLLDMAYTANRSERVEVDCNDAGVVGYEKHEPL